MTTRAYSFANLEHGQLITWSGLLNGDDGTPLYLGTDYADRSVQVLGTLGTGGTVQIEGSMAGVTYATLTDSTGTALSVAALKLRAVVEQCVYIRPRVSAGDGSTDFTVALFIRKKP